ncbi:MAG: DUF1854 domain-containing protein, partial [Phycisphaeraceae bacterium]|nr:DUF1854 domain-containing protein [Phycisphaeraceae bacterium]
LIDGLDVRKISTDDLRRQIGVVLQEPFLFRGSIYENLVYGKSNATPSEVITASKAGNCHDFILRSAHGYDTWVGERGAGLSGGERQRVSIARVVLADPRVLILDEATSSVDAESEAAIQAALGELVKGRTTIAIAHRLSTLRQADRILVVDQGRIAEDGRHDELVRADKFYAKLVRMQGVAAPSTVDELAQKDAEKKQSPETADFHPRWLTSDMAKIHLGGRGTLHVTVINDRIYSGVFAVRCFPVQHPSGYISLRYFNPEKRAVEVGIIEKLSDWPDDVQDLVRQSLLKRYLVHTVQAVKQARMLTGGFLELGVDTDLGPVTMVMRLQGDRAQDYGKGGKLLLDLDDNRYLIPDLEKLPERDRRLFTRYIYW